MKIFLYTFLTLILLINQMVFSSSSESKSPKRVKSFNGKIKIDGVLNELGWKTALKVPLNYEIDPGENITPPVKTTGLIMYGKNSLYVAFIAQDPNPEQIRAHYSKRDEIWNDDTIGIGIDTFNSGNRSFYFASNALGVQGDEIFSNGGNYSDDSWDAIWKSSAKRNKNGFIMEFEIPFNAIQFDRSAGELTWGFMLFRNYPRNKRHQISNIKVARGQSCWLCQYDKITGFNGIKPGKNMELDPTLTAFRTDNRENFPEGEMEKEDSSADIGLSGKWGITSNLNLSFAVNPDFSQIEADASQLDINTQFALYYDEKRPFFLEGNDFFNSDINVIYTRSIADPDWGVKISGKEKKHTLGMFLTHDRNTNLLLPGSQYSDQTSIDSGVYSNAFRYKYDIGKNSTIGLIATDREGKNYFNRVFGIDGLLRITKDDTLEFQFLSSSTKYPNKIIEDYDQEEGAFSGHAIKIGYRHSERNWSYKADLKKFSENFRADLGFVPQVDYYKITTGGEYTFFGKKDSFFSRLGIGGDIDQTKDSSGKLIERELEVGLSGSGPMQSFLYISTGARRYVYDEIPYDQFFQAFFFTITPSKSLSFNLFLHHGDGIDYTHSRAGKNFSISPFIKYNFGKHFSISIRQLYSRLNINTEQLYNASLSDIGLIYHFNKRMLIRGTIQYSHINRNELLYEDEIDKTTQELFTQFLFSYKLNPRTVLFLGYSDIYDQNAKLNLLQRNRTLFLKIGYALVF